MKRWLIPIILFVLGLITLLFDEFLIKSLVNLRVGFLTSFFLGIEFISSTTMVIFFLVLVSLFSKKLRFPLWFSIGTTVILGFLLKFFVQRLRPYQEKIIPIASEKLVESSHLIWNFSFPSVHAMLAFATFSIISNKFPRLRVAWLIFAILICLSRIYLGVHYVSDVLIGAAAGYALGKLGIKISNSKFIKEIKLFS
ncbi:phosphatase PAP2 family protein [archaeon]|jgi:undecaprenyl-diphosphatase|nr:phosphatase PAP2 family protein [archaeon]